MFDLPIISEKGRYPVEHKMIPIDKIIPNQFQPRVDFDKESLQELANSFKEKGVLEPIIVRKQENKYQIIAGERRWKAAKIIDLKELPAIVKMISEEDMLILSLMENLHRKDLTDTERENAIYKMWMNGRFKTQSEMAKALGVKKKSISDDIDAWEFRHQNKVSESVPTYIITRTYGLEEKERKRIIKKFEKGEFRAIDVYSVVKTIKKGSNFLRTELLQPESSITPKIAEVIVESLPNHPDQNIVVQHVKRHRLNADEVKNLAEKIRRDRNVDCKSDEIVSDIDTGYLFKCPICNHTYKIFHNEPTNTHSFRKMS